MKKDAFLSDDQNYRYTLSRIWDDDKPTVAIVGLNPSTADETLDDPTILRCIDFVKRWGFGGFYMVNLFAYRTPDPNDLYKVKDPIGVENDEHLIEVFSKVEKVICAWGKQGNMLERNKAVLALIKEPYCLKINGSGEPAHPLYLKKDLALIRYNSNQKAIVKQPVANAVETLESINLSNLLKQKIQTESDNIKVKYFTDTDKEYLERMQKVIEFKELFHFQIELSDGNTIFRESDLLLYGNFILLLRSFRVGEMYSKPNSGVLDATCESKSIVIPLDTIIAFKAVKHKNNAFLEIETEHQKHYKTVNMKVEDFIGLDRLQLKLNEMLL